MRARGPVAVGCVAVGLLAATALAQRGGAFRASRDHPAIRYSAGPVDNAASRLNTRLEAGEVQLEHTGRSGYLESLLDALDVPVESQVTVFSKTSRQASEITSSNPRAIYFTDSVAVAWVRDGDGLEVATQDRPTALLDVEELRLRVGPAQLSLL